MTRTDFQIIAEVIQGLPAEICAVVEAKFSERLKMVNPSFKRHLFAKAAGVDLGGK